MLIYVNMNMSSLVNASNKITFKIQNITCNKNIVKLYSKYME